jgi:hypothetical protein
MFDKYNYNIITKYCKQLIVLDKYPTGGITNMTGTISPGPAYDPQASQAAPRQTAEMQQRQQTRETRLEQESTPQVQSIAPQDASKVNSYYSQVSEHIDQVRYPSALQGQSFIKDGSDPELLGLLNQVIEKAPELQGTSLAAGAKAGHVTPADIQVLQNFLESKNYSVGTPGADGLYGPLTHKALSGFLTGAPPDSQQPSGNTGQAAQGQAGTGGQPSPAGTGVTQPTPAGTTGTQGTQAGTAGAQGDTVPPSGDGWHNTGQAAGAPPGYQPVKGQVPQGVAAKAKSLLGGDFGTETPFELDGKKYVARVEHHYHPPGYVGGPTGWHKGVTVYEQK